MMTTHYETTISLFTKSGEPVGEIEVQIEYEVTNAGAPAVVRYDENDQPAEGAEINVIHVWMRAPPPTRQEVIWVHCWDWLYEAACEWADENANDLAAVKRLNDGLDERRISLIGNR